MSRLVDERLFFLYRKPYMRKAACVTLIIGFLGGLIGRGRAG